MAPRILVVDRDKAFATMLQDILETEGGYAVEVVYTGSQALALLRQAAFDLTIIDTDLDPRDMACRDLILSIRQKVPDMRFMLIPLTGRDLPPEVNLLGIQAILPKPFFADDLLSDLKTALGRQIAPSLVAPQVPAAAPRAAPRPTPGLQALLSELARELNTDAVLLLSTSPGGDLPVVQVSAWDASRLRTLAEWCLATVRAAQATARFLGQPGEPFDHYIFENSMWRLYIMAVAEGELLVALTPASTPLGTIRHNLRRTARSLSGFSGN